MSACSQELGREFQSKTFTPAFSVMYIGGIFRPSLDMLCNLLKDHFAVKYSV